MNKALRNNILEILLFCIFIILLFLFLDFQTFFFLKPRSFHFIRQTDSLSFVGYYVHNGLHFFDIGNYNLYNGTGKSACEFPIIYFIAAFFTKLGFHNYLVVKYINLIIFVITSVIIFKYLRLKLNVVNSLAIFTLLCSSSVALYYSINYIPNFTALCFSLCGIVYFFKYLDGGLKLNLILFISFFLLASLLKITFAIYPITALLVLIYYNFRMKSINYNVIFYFILFFSLLLAWNLFVIKYNKENNADYYLTSIKPLWEANRFEIHEVIDFVLNYWVYKYYFPSTIHFFFIVVFISIFYFKNVGTNMRFFLLLSFTGTSFYFILFFKQFRDHDYYFLEFIPFLFILFLTSYQAINEHVNKKTTVALSLILISISCLSMNYAKLNVARRYEKPYEQVSYIAKELENINLVIDSLNIPISAKFLVIPDKTMNGSLYYLDRFGYTVGDTLSLNLEKYFLKSDYVLITDSSISKSVIQKLNLNPAILKYRGAFLYKK